jgi:hypothetical protein
VINNPSPPTHRARCHWSTIVDILHDNDGCLPFWVKSKYWRNTVARITDIAVPERDVWTEVTFFADLYYLRNGKLYIQDANIYMASSQIWREVCSDTLPHLPPETSALWKQIRADTPPEGDEAT